MTRLSQRIHRLEAQRRPAHVTAVLRRVRECSHADLGACLLAELTAVDRATVSTIMDPLTDAELEALMGPDAVRLMETLSESELEALARGDPGALQRFERSCQRWRYSRS